ncbi:GntR family transcriptional regulator [Alteribacillus sp. YIM 98480]|uniref:GntR family transcriptional regulator n=1 Tax=Alteribacillus sp. YIM 98480 TaxID=2606599 RepID=UPI00131D1A31|nr:GntR family transcriptional regulator [Alteribacillus sp. YIM 98480]
MPAPTLKEKAYQEMKKLLLTGEIKPGDFLSERTLVERLDMSRTPIRSALDRLELDGFIKQSPQQGIVVQELSINKAAEIYELRKALESFVVNKLSNMELTKQQRSIIEENLSLQKRYVEENDIPQFTLKDAEFHHQLITFADNEEIIDINEQIQDRLNLIAVKVFKLDDQRIIVSYDDHKEIFEHILKGQGEKAAAKMTEHLEYGRRILMP